MFVGLRLGRGCLGLALAVCVFADVPRARAESPRADASGLGPKLSSGVRRVDEGLSATPGQPELAPSGPQALRPTHRVGPAPKEPKATLPDRVPASEPDVRARRRVALGRTREEHAAPKADPELRALAEAEQTIFASDLRGIRPGWSWTHEPDAATGTTQVVDSGLPPTPAPVPEETDGRELARDAEWLRSLARPDLPVRMDARVVKYLKFYRDSEQGQTIVHVWAKKAGKYAPALREEFGRAGLPKDLIWLSLIESGHNPTIKSPAGAAGLWQFIPASARMYGLTVDRWVDERLDPARSTQAAIRFLSDLHQRFGSWELAMAAYNMGYGGMSRAIQKFNTNDFWQLSRYEAGIPWETTLYVPKILAIAIVMNNKKAFGIDDVIPDPPERFDRVLVRPGQSLSDVARAARISRAQFESMNPQYLAGRTPPAADQARRWPVRVPGGTGESVSAQLASAAGGAGQAPYRVRFGDTLAAIAADYGVAEHELAELNGLSKKEWLRSGTVLLLPASAVRARPTGREVVVVPPSSFRYTSRRRVFYRVRQGDALSAIASAFRVTQAELTAWNSIDSDARLQPEMVLQVFVDEARILEDVRHLEEAEVELFVAGTAPFYDHHEALNGRARLVVICDKGDTLASVGKRYGMSVGSMERVNRRSRQDPLEPGDKLVVYAQQTQPAPGSRGAEDPVALGRADAPHPELLPSAPVLRPGGSRGSLPAASRALD